MINLETKVFSLSDTNPDVILTSYVCGTSNEVPFNNKRKALLILPGGGYHFCSDREAEPVALEFLSRGYNVFVLRYTVNHKDFFPTQLIEASLAMKLIRDRAEEFRIDPDYVFVMGFSAGAHLAASLGTLWYKDYIYEKIDMPKGCNRPTGMILSYPVITSGKYAHRGSFCNLLGDKVNDESAMREVSLEYAVTENTVPAFIWHTRTDTCVPIQNSLLFAQALADAGTPFELHVYPEGVHGMSLCTKVIKSDNPYNAQWVDCAYKWMERF